jgi:hypothetical protein
MIKECFGVLITLREWRPLALSGHQNGATLAVDTTSVVKPKGKRPDHSDPAAISWKLSIPAYRRGRLSAQKALAAIDRPALSRFKGHRGFPTALRAGGHGFRFVKARGRGTLALGLAILAALGLVLKILVVEEVLFSRCENKICSAVHAL